MSLGSLNGGAVNASAVNTGTTGGGTSKPYYYALFVNGLGLFLTFLHPLIEVFKPHVK